MNSSASVNLVSNPELEKLFKSRPDIKAGDKLEAKVLDVRNDGKAVLDFGKFQASVDLKVPVEVGDTVRLEVVEKARQLKLKVEQVNSHQPKELQNLVREANVHQEQSLEELHSRIDRLLQKEISHLKSGDSGKPEPRVLEDIGKELSRLKEHIKTTGAREPVPKEVKKEVTQLLEKVEITLKELPKTDAAETSQRLETLSRSIRSLRTAMETSREFSDLQDRVAKEVAQIKELVSESNIPNKQEAEVLTAKLTEAAEKVANLKGPEQLQEMRRIIREEIQPNLKELKEVVVKSAELAVPASDDSQRMEEAAQRIDNLFQAVATVLPEVPAPVSQPVELTIPQAPSGPVEISTHSSPSASEQNIALNRFSNLRTTPEPPPDFHQMRDQVVKEIEQLKEMVEKLDIPAKKELEIRIAKLSEAAEKIAELKGPEQLNELRRIVREEVQPNLTELNEIVSKSTEQAVPASNDIQQLQEIRQQMDTLFKAVEVVLPEAPSAPVQPIELSVPQAPAQAVELTMPRSISMSGDLAALSRFRTLKTTPDPPPDVHQLKEDMVKEITRLKAMVEDLEVPDRKELETRIAKLSEAAEKIQNLKGPEAEQMQQLRQIVAEEVRPNLNELRDVVNRETRATAADTLSRQQIEAVKQQIETLEKVAEIALQPPPESAPPEKVEVLMERVELALSHIARPDAPPPAPPQEPIRPELNLRIEIADELAKLERTMEPLPQREPLPDEVKPRVENLMERVETTLRELPDTYKSESTERLEPLFKELRQFRISLDVQRDFQDLKDRLVQDIAKLKVLAEELDGPARREVETKIAKLTEAAEKISRLKGPEQLPELRRIVAEEVKPNISELRNVLSQSLETAAPGSEAHQRISDMMQRMEQLQRDIDVNLPRLPEVPPPASDIDAMIKPVETALAELAQLPQAAPVDGQTPQFSESVQNIYENIKTALRLLQNNLKVSGGQLEIPEEIRQVFENLQSDLKAAEATDMVLEQLTSLRDLIQKADLPIEKVVHEVVESLNDIITRISDLKEGSKFREIRELVHKQLGPQLKMLGDVFGSERLMGALELRDQVAAESVRTAVRQLQGGIESVFVRGEPVSQSSELAQLTEFTDKLASLSRGASGQAMASGKAAESIANLSQNIEEMLSRLPDHSSTLNNTAALPAKIRSLLSTLQSHFEPLDIGQDAMKLVPRLKSLVDDSGVFFEKKVSDVISKIAEASSRIQNVQSLDQLPEIRSIIDNDMKPNLLQLRELLNNNQITAQLGDAKSLDTIRSAVEDLLSNIGAQQERAVDSQSSQAQVQVFSFHVPIKGEETAELKVFYNKGRKKDSPDEFKMSLLLEMGKLGEIRSDFFHFKEDLSVTFFVRDDNVKTFLEDNFHELEEALEPMFNTLNLNIMVASPRLPDADAEDVSQQVGQQIISDKEVDVKI